MVLERVERGGKQAIFYQMFMDICILFGLVNGRMATVQYGSPRVAAEDNGRQPIQWPEEDVAWQREATPSAVTDAGKVPHWLCTPA